MRKGTIVLADVNLGEILWSLLVLYLMFMYFLVVIIVILDMFRSDDLSGWLKALWSVALIAFPIVALLVYLVMRGDGMGLRSLARERHAADAVPPPPPPPPTATNRVGIGTADGEGPARQRRYLTSRIRHTQGQAPHLRQSVDLTSHFDSLSADVPIGTSAVTVRRDQRCRPRRAWHRERAAGSS